MRTSIYRIPSLFRQKYAFLGFVHRTLLLPGLIFWKYIPHRSNWRSYVYITLRLEYTVLSLRYLFGSSLTTMKSSNIIRLLYWGCSIMSLCPASYVYISDGCSWWGVGGAGRKSLSHQLRFSTLLGHSRNFGPFRFQRSYLGSDLIHGAADGC